MIPNVMFGGLYLLVLGGLLSIAQALAGAASANSILTTYGLLIIGALVAIIGTWARGRG
jgi:hypothetical protein